jgi:hypothetical protein
MNGNNRFRPDGRLKVIFIFRSVIRGDTVPRALAGSQIVTRVAVELADAILLRAPTFPHFLGHSRSDIFLPTQCYNVTLTACQSGDFGRGETNERAPLLPPTSGSRHR